MRQILVPFDFSDQATSAFRFAWDVVNRSKGEIHLVHVVEVPVLHNSVLMPTLSFEAELLRELQQDAERRFAKIKQKHAPDSEKLKLKVIFGVIHRVIVDYIKTAGIDLVAMGTRGVGGWREMLIGSNTERVVRRSPVPVITLKKYVSIDSLRNIVFPVTGESEQHTDLAEKVKALQQFLKARLHLVRINTPGNFASDTVARERLTAFAERFGLTDHTIHIFNHTDEETGILYFAESIKADMIAIGTRGRTGIAHLLSGSLAEDMVNHLNYPVWTYTLKPAED